MRHRFKLLVYESTGQKYEDLFVKVMGYADSSFKPVKAHGNIGDRGNDGWCASSGKYFQVYAPDDLPRNNKKSIKKMKEDFDKLMFYWNKISPIKEYHFVVNDQYKGVSPHIYEAISELKNQHNLKYADVFLSKDLENKLFTLSQDVITSVLAVDNCDKKQKSIYEYLVDELTRKMYLQHWQPISDNLIANSIWSDVIDGFSEATMLVFRTEFPNTIPSFETSIRELANRTDALVLHFTESQFACLSDDLKFWHIDMQWKREWINDRNEYDKKYDLYENWRRQLYCLHSNLVHALNIFSQEVRKHVYPDYFMNQQFTIVYSLGTFNGFKSYEAIPDSFKEVN